MQIGWWEFIKSRFKRTSNFHCVGIELGLNDIHISTVQKQKGQLHWVKQHSAPINNWQASLKTYVENNQLAHTQCNIALSITKYQMLQIERPAVEDAELNQALQWAVKEQLASDDEFAIDYFDPPASTSNVKKLNVVAISKQEIIALRDGILNAELTLKSIDVEELTICNLLAPNDDAIITLKQEQGGQLSLSIIKRNQLYFSRRLHGYENLASFSEEELKLGVVDNLSLEIQRSMDYFESQLRQAPVKKIYASLDTAHQDALAEMIKQVIFISVETFIPNVSKSSDIPMKPSSLASLGAAINDPNLVAS